MNASKAIIRLPFLIVTLGLVIGGLLGQWGQWSSAETMITNFPYEMSVEQRKQFLTTIERLRVGDNYEQVIKILGRPFDEKSVRGKMISDPVRGVALTYYLKKILPDMVNEVQDEYVLLVFDNDKKLVCAYANVARLPLASDLTQNWPGCP